MSGSSGRNEPFGHHLKPEFLLDPEIAYLNHGAHGAPPREVIEAAHEAQRRMEREPSRFVEREFRPRLREVAAELAGYLGADGANLALVENASVGVNVVLRGLEFSPGDEILITDQTYGAVRNAVRYVAARTGAVPVEAALPFPTEAPEQIVEAFARHLGPRTRLAIIDHITSPTALVLPLAELVARAKAAGAQVLVDGAHAPGMLPLALSDLGADWYTGNCHKWLMAARGTAFLWAAEQVRASTHPLVISHGYEQGFTREFDWIGTRDAFAQFALPAALAYRRRHGEAAIRAYNHDLVMAASEMLAARWGTAAGGPATMTGSMRAVRLPDGFEATAEAAQALRWRLADDYQVPVPVRCLAGGLWARLSAQIYNEIGDYERLAAALRSRPA